MRRLRWAAWTGALALAACGCALYVPRPLDDNPLLLKPAGPDACVENPVYVPGGPPAYGQLFEHVLDILSDYQFDVAFKDRYDGRIETFPTSAPGFERSLIPGNPCWEDRWIATLQSIRQRVIVLIQVANNGGFFVEVKVFKELEDLPNPVHATPGAAAFRSDNTVERQYAVIDATIFQSSWIPIGRNVSLEQAILQRIKKCM
jgi:hypothetical protein